VATGTGCDDVGVGPEALAERSIPRLERWILREPRRVWATVVINATEGGRPQNLSVNETRPPISHHLAKAAQSARFHFLNQFGVLGTLTRDANKRFFFSRCAERPGHGLTRTRRGHRPIASMTGAVSVTGRAHG